MNVPVPIGETLAGKYRIERVLGEGGMGVVVAALHLQLEQLVAIKFLLAEAMKREELVARFAREARVLAKLTGEHVGRVIDVGTTDDGVPYMVMEYLDGRDLERELEVRGPLPIAEAVDYLLQATEAVAEAHAHGIVHRDLKPANLFLAKKAKSAVSVKVLDFGISKSTKDTQKQQGLTHDRAIMGSPLYMSPEQLSRAADADVRSDVWSLGVILYELTTAKLPFDGETMPQLLTAVLHGKPTPLLEARPDAPPGLAVVIERCLEKDPARRYKDVAGLARALEPYGNPRAAMSVERIHAALPAPFPPSLPPTVPPPPSHERISIVPTGRHSLPKNLALASTATSSTSPDLTPTILATRPAVPSPRRMYVALGGFGLALVALGVVSQRRHASAASAEGSAEAGVQAQATMIAPSAASALNTAPSATSLPVPWPSSTSPTASASASVAPPASAPATVQTTSPPSTRAARASPGRANMPAALPPAPPTPDQQHWKPVLK
jgi:serine/threonine-protein kinase